MKNLSLVLNVVLVIAVAVLFYLHFSSPRAATAENGNNENDTNYVAPVKVKKEARNYFVNMDTLNAKYKLFLEGASDIKAKLTSLETSYQTSMQKYQQDYITLQQRIQENNITADEAQRMEDNLRNLEQKIQGFERSRDYLMEEMDKRTNEARMELDSFMEEYKKGKNIDFVFSHSSILQTMVLRNDSLDITNEVLKGLNERYDAKKSQPKK